MSLADDLLEQARHLAHRERGKPKQASLRRAVSSAYYALFHLLIEEAARQSIPASGIKMRSLAKRSVNHGDLKKVSGWFSTGGNLPSGVTLRSAPSTDLRFVTTVCIFLQQRRHDADYDTTARFNRSRVAAMVDDTEKAFAAWQRVRAAEEGRAFLTLLLITDRWRR